MASPDLTDWLHATLQQHLGLDNDTDAFIYALLAPEVDAKPVHPCEPVSLAFLQQQCDGHVAEKGPMAAGAVARPYYRAAAHTLSMTWGNGGQLPPLLLQNPVHLLASTNKDRLYQIQEKFTQCVQQDDLAMLEQLLFQEMTLQEWRLWLMMRTTVGSQSVVWPPSLHECLVAFTTIHRKPPKAKKRKDNDDECKKGENAAGTPCYPKKQKPVAPNILTVGAKALSKHWHRDRQTSFWGICTGSETAKNQHANQCLLNILFNAVWINLHSLPHDHLVYEIREPNGYGVRWSTSALDKQWMFRGFLEPQMEDGHDRGWVH